MGREQSEYGSRRLGAVLRLLTGPVESLQPLMKGLSAAKLIALPPPEAGYHVEFKIEEPSDSKLHNDLSALKLKALKQRAREMGVEEQQLEDADNADNVRGTVTKLVLEAAQSNNGHDRAAEQESELAPLAADGGNNQLREELVSMKLSALRRRAVADGVDEDAMEEAADGDDEKSALVQLILSCQTSGGEDARLTELRSELSALKLSALRKRAVAQGMDEDEMEAAADGEDEKGMLIAALLAQPAPATAAAADNRPHFGSGKQQAQRSKPKPASRKGLLPANKHAMISYQWDDQDRVIAARETLVRLGVPCWMDIDGGMQQDIYESMAEGVENAACVVCFLSQKYQSSENCKLELKFAKQSGVPIVPVMVESTQGWRPSGWLGIVVAGALWTSLRDDSEFESSVRGLVGQIKGAVPGSGDGVLSDDDDHEEEGEAGADAGAELRAELARLRKATDAKAVVKDVFTFDRDAPAEVFAGVPELPEDFRPTEKISTLRQNLLHSTTPTKIGFWGMGGIGKTVTGAALVRDADVRDHFDQIVWLPLGQTPVMEKLQSSALEQLCGKQMEPNLSEDERHDALREAFKGKRVLLALDDLWEEAHAPQLNFVDASCGSRVLISTRIRHLLSDAFSVEIGKPSVDDSISILMAAAELGDTGDAPAEAAEIVELCGRLPLALVMTGKLVLDLDVGSKWDGVTSILRDELRGDEQVASREQAVIRASLAGLKGSERDTTGGRQLFKLFGLVPEDTSCPLECLQMMYDAVYEPQRPTSVLHIRKWLKILIDRSLVLGTVDRASLHDLVLDFTISMHSKAELAAAHRRVVEAFRSNRPLTAAGLEEWSSLNRDHAIVAYVVDDAAHHIIRAHDADDPQGSDELLLGWITDVHDALVAHIGVVLGEVKLVSAAEKAERDDEMWQAACRWYAAGLVVFSRDGASPKFQEHLKHSSNAIVKARQPKAGSTLPSSVDLMDHLELDAITRLAAYSPAFFASRGKEMANLLTSNAATFRIDACVSLLAGAVLGSYFDGDLQKLKLEANKILSFLVRSGCEGAKDPAMREFSTVMLAACSMFSFVDLQVDFGDFDWTILGAGGKHIAGAAEHYDYDK